MNNRRAGRQLQHGRPPPIRSPGQCVETNGVQTDTCNSAVIGLMFSPELTVETNGVRTDTRNGRAYLEGDEECLHGS